MADDPAVTTDAEPEAEAVEETPTVETPAVETPAHWSRGEGMGFDDDTVGWLENKGFENPQAAITAQRDLEKKLGGPAEMLQKWPQSDDTEGFKAIYERLGTPKDVEGYKFDFEEGAAVDPDTLAWFKQSALGRNMPNDMAFGLIQDWNAEVARLQEAQQQEIEVRDQAEKTELANAWGTKLDERLDYGHRALLSLGLDEEGIEKLQSAMGPKMTAQFAAKIADTMGEDTIAANTTTPAFGVSKEQVQNQIAELNGEIGADKARYDKYLADHSAPQETTGQDYRKMQQLDAQLGSLLKAEQGAT